MKLIKLTLVLILIFIISGVLYAQMNNSNTNQQNFRATVQTGPTITRGMPQSADIFVNNKLAMRIPVSAAGMTPMERARIIADRMNRAFASGMSYTDMQIRQMNGSWVVAMGNVPIATADNRSARVFGISSRNLANRWARQSVVALGGPSRMVASRMNPVNTRVAGSRQERGSIIWSTTPTKSVPLISADNGNQLGNVVVAGPDNRLNNVNSVAVYQYTTGNAMVWSFVPVSGTSITSTMNRSPYVGLVSIPSGLLPASGMSTGSDITSILNQPGAVWNNRVNTGLPMARLQPVGASKIVPLYSTETGDIIGAAQVVGLTQGITKTQAVVISGSGDMMQLMATSDQNPSGSSTALTNVVVSALITFPQEGATPNMTQPESSTPATPGAANGDQNPPDNMDNSGSMDNSGNTDNSGSMDNPDNTDNTNSSDYIN